MNHREEITAELKQIDPLMAQWPFQMPYSVPVGYFDVIAEKLLEQASTELAVEKSQAYAIPAGYFDQLPGNILAAIHKQEVVQELEELAPSLNFVSKQMPYERTELPALNMEAIMERVAMDKIPVIQMPVRKVRKWMPYAAAAVVTGVILATAFLFNGTTGEETNSLNYAQVDVSQEMSKLSEEELNTYLATTEKLVINTGDRDMYGIEALPEVDEHIEMSSDDELKQYLNESTESLAEAKADS